MSATVATKLGFLFSANSHQVNSEGSLLESLKQPPRCARQVKVTSCRDAVQKLLVMRLSRSIAANQTPQGLVTGVAGLLVLVPCRSHLYLNVTILQKFPGSGHFSVTPAYVSYHERRN